MYCSTCLLIMYTYLSNCLSACLFVYLSIDLCIYLSSIHPLSSSPSLSLSLSLSPSSSSSLCDAPLDVHNVNCPTGMLMRCIFILSDSPFSGLSTSRVSCRSVSSTFLYPGLDEINRKHGESLVVHSMQLTEKLAVVRC